MIEKLEHFVFVLTWEYGDKSSSGVERVYDAENRANEDLVLLSTHGDISKKFTVKKMKVTEV